MASPAEQFKSLAEEATCPICLGYFAEPVSVQCGHTFCTRCITRYWERVQGAYPCPQCRETAPSNTLRPNRNLANMVQILAQGHPVAPLGEGPHMCTEHDEKLKLFCREDQTPICVVCDRSREHRGHNVTPIGEAAQEYKDQFQNYLEDVKRELENILGLHDKQKATLKDLEVNFKSQRERITCVFNMVQQFLEKEKCRHLSNLEEKEKRALQETGEKLSELDKRQASVKEQITQIELKCQQPDVEFLKDVKSISSRFEQLKNLTLYSGNFKEKQMGPSEEVKEEKNEVDKKAEQEDVKGDVMLKIIESLEWRWARCFAGAVTLDPDTAHGWLVLSEDGRSVSYGETVQDLPDTPERFNPAPIVLGRERLRSGRHYWEVEVGGKTGWDLGVCDESASRKGRITASPESGNWVVWLRDGKYKALTSPMLSLTPSVPPRVVGLFLDYEGGRFSVYNVTDQSLLFTFPEASFPLTLRPFFYPGLTDGGKNATPLRMLPVTGQE